MYICMHVHIHIGDWTYLCGCVECMCMVVCILCMNYSSTSPCLSGDDQIRMCCNLKDFNLIIVALLRVS